MEHYFKKVQAFFGKDNCSLDRSSIIFQSQEFADFDNFFNKFKQFLHVEECPYRQFDLLVNYDVESSTDNQVISRYMLIDEIFVDTIEQLEIAIGCPCPLHIFKKINYIEVIFHNSYNFDC